jgi:hypothetical protein
MGLHLFSHASEAHIAVEVGAGDKSEKELRSIRIRPCVRHREEPWLIVLQPESLILNSRGLLWVDNASVPMPGGKSNACDSAQSAPMWISRKLFLLQR